MAGEGQGVDAHALHVDGADPGGLGAVQEKPEAVLLVAAPAFIYFSEASADPGALHAPILLSLAAGLIVGALAQWTRLCMVGGIRDLVLFREWKLLMGFLAILVSALICNLVLTAVKAGTFFTLGLEGQPVAHTDGLWNFLGMLLTGFGCVLLGGCPLRQLVLSGEGNTDSAITVLGLAIGAAFAHNFGLASCAGCGRAGLRRIIPGGKRVRSEYGDRCKIDKACLLRRLRRQGGGRYALAPAGGLQDPL